MIIIGSIRLMNNLTVMVAGTCAFVEEAGTSSSSGSRCPSLSGMQAKVVVVCERNKESVTCTRNVGGVFVFVGVFEGRISVGQSA